MGGVEPRGRSGVWSAAEAGGPGLPGQGPGRADEQLPDRKQAHTPIDRGARERVGCDRVWVCCAAYGGHASGRDAGRAAARDRCQGEEPQGRSRETGPPPSSSIKDTRPTASTASKPSQPASRPELSRFGCDVCVCAWSLVGGWVGGQMSRLGVQVNDLTKLTGKLDSVPTEAQVREGGPEQPRTQAGGQAGKKLTVPGWCCALVVVVGSGHVLEAGQCGAVGCGRHRGNGRAPPCKRTHLLQQSRSLG